MKKLLLCSGMLLLCYASNAQDKKYQSPKFGYSMCTEIIGAKRMLLAGLGHKDVAFRTIYMKDAHDCATNAYSMYIAGKDSLNKKLTAEEVKDLGESIAFLDKVSSQLMERDLKENEGAKIAMMSELLDRRFTAVFSKLLQ